MKKILFFACISAMLASCSNVVPEPQELTKQSPETDGTTHVTLEKALENAEALFSRMEGKNTRTDTRKRVVRSIQYLAEGGKTRAEGEDPLYYVVNYADDAGFAILGADTRLDKVYAFSDTGSLNLNDTTFNEGLREYIYGLPLKPSYPKWEIDTTLHQFRTDIGQTENASYKIGPLLSSAVRKWRQEDPFNYYMSEYFDQIENKIKKMPAGCTAVACAQIMSFFKWPTNYYQFTFDWNQMDELTTSNGIPTYLGIPRLLLELGTSKNLDITYKPDGSGANIKSHGKRTFEHFGYNVSGKFKSYSESDLSYHFSFYKTPLIVTGKKSESAHCWVCDGLYCDQWRTKWSDSEYQYYGEGYFYHMVWGWSGQANGYFKYGTSFTVNHKYKENDDYPESSWFPRLYEYIRYTDLEFWGGFSPAR